MTKSDSKTVTKKTESVKNTETDSKKKLSKAATVTSDNEEKVVTKKQVAEDKPKSKKASAKEVDEVENKQTKSKVTKSNAKKVIEKNLKEESEDEEVEQQMEVEESEEEDDQEQKQVKKVAKKKEPQFKLASEALIFIEEQQDIVYKAMAAIRNATKEYKKLFNREQKQMKSHKKAERDPNKPVKKSGFNKETIVPENIRNFLNNYCGDDFKIEDDQLKARTWVTKAIYNYIHTNELSDKDNGRIINADEALAELFGIEKGSEIHFESFQTLLSNAYKNTKNLVTEAEESEAEESEAEESEGEEEVEEEAEE